MLEAFYNTILPDQAGQHIVATLDKKRIQHYVVDSTDEIVPFLKGFPEHNTYHSLGAYKGLTPGKIHSVKDLEGCQAVRSFGFDLDVGEADEKYDTLPEAFEDLDRCTKEGLLPKPTVTLYSGGGLQFYLTLNEDLEEGPWSLRFQQLRSHLSQHLKIDRTVGSHPYRLLRSPCTPNWKYGEPVQPEILDTGETITLDWLDTLPEVEAPKKASKKKEGEDSLNCDEPVPMKKVLKACAAMRQQFDTKGAETSYPVWFATGNISAHTMEYRKGFHHLSKNHPSYNKEEADEKFDEIVSNASHGPFGCEHFGNVEDPNSPCHGCWAAKAGLKNPVSAARNLKKKPRVKPKLDEIAEIEDEPEIIASAENNYGIPEEHLPEGLEATEDSIVNDKGDVCDRFFVKPMQYNDERETGNVLISKDSIQWHSFPARNLSTPTRVVAELLNIGVYVRQDKETMMYVRTAATSGDMSTERSRFGWGPEFDNAYLPNGSVGTDTEEPSQDLIRLQRKWQGEKGTLKGWLEAIEIYGRKGQEAYLMCVLASLASPLLAYHVGLEKGVILSLTGPGGTGKTTALKVAASIWGKPLSTLSSMSSTFVATRIYLGLCGHLPMILDEVTQMQPEDLKQFALEISQGLGRERGTQEARLAHSEQWQLNCLTTSNVSIHAKLAELIDIGSADMNRVVELPVVQSEYVSVQQGNDMLDGINENHGQLGRIFIEHIMTKDILHERSQFKKLHKALRDKDALKGSDRFADGLIASCYWAHKRIKEIVPNFPGDPDEQFLWMREQLQRNNRYIMDILTVRIPTIDDFILEYYAENLVLNHDQKKGYFASGTSLKGYLYDYEERLIVPKSTLEMWCKKHMIKSRTVLERWGRTGRLINMGPEDGNHRWTGKLKTGLKIEGKTKYPTVLLIRKEEGDGEVS